MPLQTKVKHISIFIDEKSLDSYKEYCKSIGISMHTDILNHISDCINSPKNSIEFEIWERQKDEIKLIDSFNDLGFINRAFGDDTRYPNINKRQYHITKKAKGDHKNDGK